VVVLGVIVVLMAAVVVLAGQAMQRHRNAAVVPQQRPQAPSLVAVAREDLSDSQELPATLGRGKPIPFNGRAKGTVTRLPAVGAVIERGRPLLWVDDRPVTVFFGDTPMFRPLDKVGMEGHDVQVLATNLTALGYDIGQEGRRSSIASNFEGGATRVFTKALSDALKRWQDDHGLKANGTLALGDVAVLPFPPRIASVSGYVGDDAAEPVLSYTSRTKVVVMSVELTALGPIRRGLDVSVVLPSGGTVPAVVSAVGSQAQAVQDGDESEPTQVTVPVTIKLKPKAGRQTKALASLDTAPVQVQIRTNVQKDVLTLPVDALMALKEGGYAVQLPDGTLRAVKTGTFSRGLVEISGSGITEGLKVVTAS
jgi:peptidoglycan hydrolase-like protein with peptidoglycan-binding domain